jgi:hypothetical protein
MGPWCSRCIPSALSWRWHQRPKEHLWLISESLLIQNICKVLVIPGVNSLVSTTTHWLLYVPLLCLEKDVCPCFSSYCQSRGYNSLDTLKSLFVSKWVTSFWKRTSSADPWGLTNFHNSHRPIERGFEVPEVSDSWQRSNVAKYINIGWYPYYFEF